MARKFKLQLPTVKKVVGDFIVNPKPSLARLIRELKLTTYNQLYRYMELDNDIGRLLSDAYLYLIQTHEERLFNNSATGSIFFLKCLRKIGVTYNEYAPLADGRDSTNLSSKLKIEVVSKDSNNNEISQEIERLTK